MAIRSVTRVGAFFVLTATSAVTNAALVQFDGRYYEVVPAGNSGISWDAANTAANLKTTPPNSVDQNGNAVPANLQGHLATINSDAENDVVSKLNVPTGNRPHLWIGGFQNPCTQEPGCGWQWVNGELIAATNTASPYTKWQQPPQPDNSNSSNRLAITPFAQGGGWADSRTQDVWGYVVEYGDKFAPFAASTCGKNGPGCKLAAPNANGSVITLPVNPPSGSLVTVSVQLVTNDTARCGLERLSLFNGEVIVPKYLCGHPDFLVAKADFSGTAFQINQGIVDVLNGNELLTGNLYECQAGGVDPTEADVVGYQSSQNMLEAGFTGIPDELVGSVGEFTTLCGSSRGTLPGRSWYFAGLRIHPGPGNDAVTNPDGNRAFRFRVLNYKLDVLALAVSNACDNNGPKAYTQGVCSSLNSQITVLKGDITNGNDTEAKAHARNFEKTVRGAKLTVIPGENHDGELTSRIKNFSFTLAKFFP